MDNIEQVENFNVIKGFLNLVVQKDYWLNILMEACDSLPIMEKHQLQKIQNL
jgi:hypothetical protein